MTFMTPRVVNSRFFFLFDDEKLQITAHKISAYHAIDDSLSMFLHMFSLCGDKVGITLVHQRVQP